MLNAQRLHLQTFKNSAQDRFWVPFGKFSTATGHHVQYSRLVFNEIKAECSAEIATHCHFLYVVQASMKKETQHQKAKKFKGYANVPASKGGGGVLLHL